MLSFAQEAIRLFEEEKRLSWHGLVFEGACNLASSHLVSFEGLTLIYLLHVYSLFPLDVKLRTVSPEVI